MNFYSQYYCGIDLRARTLYVCILDQAGEILVHQNLPAEPAPFLKVIAPLHEDIVVAVGYIFTWSWLADLCHQEGISFVLGHALYMKAIHGGNAKFETGREPRYVFGAAHRRPVPDPETSLHRRLHTC